MEINHNWEFRQAGNENWLPATVPGTVHTDLLANKVIEDPYYRLNEKQLQWIDKADWEYRNVFLYGDGINGQFSDNYFDILPGQEVSVTISKRDVFSDINKSLKILHLYLTDND